MCEVYFSAPLRNLCEFRKLRAVVYSNRLENLTEAITVFITENLHRRHDITAGFARDADSQIVLGLLLNERENNGFFP